MIKSLYSQKLLALQGLRAYAAVLVVVAHAVLTFYKKVLGGDFGSMPAGTLGVKIFFLISGFIIYTTTKKLKQGVVGFRVFVIKRLIRILPLYYGATIIYYLKLSFQGVNVGYEQLILSFMFIPFVNHEGLMQPVLGQGWTLNFEMFFYTIFALAILVLSQWRLAFVSGVLGIFCLLSYFFPLSADSSDVLKNFYFYTDLNSLGYFVGGMLVARLRMHFPSFGITNELSAMIVVFFVLSLFLFLYDDLLDSGVLVSAQIAIFGVVCFVICVFVSDRASEENLFTRFLHLCGDASYSIYLFHGFILGTAARLLTRLHIDFSMTLYVVVMVVTCLAFGMFTYNYVEQPLIRKLNSMLLS